MRTLQFIIIGSLFFTTISSLQASSFDKIRTKELAKEGRKGYIYKKIRTKKELKEFEKEGGVNLNKIKSKKVKAYIDVRNVRENRITSGGYKRGLKKHTTRENLGVMGTLKSGHKISSTINIKNSRLGAKNLGVEVKAKKVHNVNIESNTNIKNSKIGGR